MHIEYGRNDLSRKVVRAIFDFTCKEMCEKIGIYDFTIAYSRSKKSNIWYPNQNSTWPLEKKQVNTTWGSYPLNANDNSPNFCPLLHGEAPSALSPRGAGGKSPLHGEVVLSTEG